MSEATQHWERVREDHATIAAFLGWASSHGLRLQNNDRMTLLHGTSMDNSEVIDAYLKVNRRRMEQEQFAARKERG
jgi:hypothetical protein